MGFESVRGYFQLASGLGELTRARATEAAQGLLSMPGVGVATGKVAGQVTALAEELLAQATINREHLTTLVRSEVDVAVTRLGLVSAEKLAASQAETARLRAQVAELRSASSTAAAAPAKRSTPRKVPAKAAPQGTAVKKGAAKKAPAKRAALKKAAVKKTSAAKAATVSRGAVTTRRRSDGE